MILSLYGRIRVSDNPYSRIFYGVFYGVTDLNYQFSSGKIYRQTLYFQGYFIKIFCCSSVTFASTLKQIIICHNLYL